MRVTIRFPINKIYLSDLSSIRNCAIPVMVNELFVNCTNYKIYKLHIHLTSYPCVTAELDGENFQQKEIELKHSKINNCPPTVPYISIGNGGFGFVDSKHF